jgi:hypothetical protein
MKARISRESLRGSFMLGFLLVTGLAFAQSQPQTAAVARKGPEIPAASRHSAKAPLGDSEAVPVESSVRARGRAIAEQHGAGTYPAIVDPGLTVNGRTEDWILSIVDYYGDRGGDFRSDSNSVVTGAVTGATSFLSRDRTWVYSDFDVKVEGVLKQDSTQPVVEGETLLGYRGSGAIKFPSGHITDYITQGEGFPGVGDRYVFFLSRWPDQVGGRYYISTAYQLKDGLVYPLDLNVNGGATEPGKHVMGVQYSEYEEMKEDTFMEKVRDAIAAQVKDRSK